MENILIVSAFLFLLLVNCDSSSLPVIDHQSPEEETNLPNELGPRIIGGEFAAPGEFPYYVQVMSQLGDYFPSCGGSLIDGLTIITAAHCVWDGDEPAKMILVKSNSKNRLLLSKQPFEWEIINGTKLIVHENYTITNEGIPLNDIAIIKLDSKRLPSTLSPTRKGIRLASKKYPIGTQVVLAGFGLTESGRSPDFLKKKKSSVISNDNYADNQLPGVLFTQRSDEDLVYIGDSGGPVVVKGKSPNQDELIGIISFGDDYLDGNREGSTDIYHYLNWIRTKIGSS